MDSLKHFFFTRKGLSFLALFILLPVSLRAQTKQEKLLLVQEKVRQIVEKHGVPGAAVAMLASDSVIWRGTMGLADVGKGIMLTDSSLFGLGSIAKTILSMAAMRAQEKGLLSLQEPVEKLIPRVSLGNPWQATDPLRLIHLLELTSGIDEAHFSLFHQADSTTPFAEVLRKSKNALTSRWKPGHYYAYNSLGAIVAAYAFEESVQAPFENFVKKEILSPLQMKKATYHPGEAQRAYLSKGYAGLPAREEPFPSIPQWPAGSLVASVQDMSNVVSLFLNEGVFQGKEVLSRASIRSMETTESSLRAKNGVQVGYGKGLRKKFEGGELFYGHDGSYGGFLSEFGYSRELGVGYVILLNNRDGSAAMKAIKQELLGCLIAPKEFPDQPLAKANDPSLAQVAGCYQPFTSQLALMDFAWRLINIQFIVEENGRLVQKSVVGDRQPLFNVGNKQFKKAGEPMASSVFVKGEGGEWLWLEEEAYRKIPLWLGYGQLYAAFICLALMAFTLLFGLFWVPRMFFKKKHAQLKIYLWPFLAVLAFLGMGISLTFFYEPMQKLSPGAMGFFVFGWLFFAWAYFGLFKSLKAMFTGEVLKPWLKYTSFLSALAVCVVSAYLFYWGVIGLALWSY